MAYINTITIAPQESADNLAAAFAVALGTAIGWTVDGTNVWQDKTKDGLRFAFAAFSTIVYFYVGNSIGTFSSNSLPYAANAYYCLDYYNTGSTIAFGARKSGTAAITLHTLCVRNTMGKYKMLEAYSTFFDYVDISVSSAKRYYLVTSNNDDGISTSIVKAPDIWDGCMFQDLYLMISCPQNSTDKVFYINGQYYRYVGIRGTEGFAIPVG